MWIEIEGGRIWCFIFYFKCPTSKAHWNLLVNPLKTFHWLYGADWLTQISDRGFFRYRVLVTSPPSSLRRTLWWRVHGRATRTDLTVIWRPIGAGGLGIVRNTPGPTVAGDEGTPLNCISLSTEVWDCLARSDIASWGTYEIVGGDICDRQAIHTVVRWWMGSPGEVCDR